MLTILGSVFYGYILSQIAGGYLATRFGGKHVFGAGLLATSLLTIATPLAAAAGVEVLIALRVYVLLRILAPYRAMGKKSTLLCDSPLCRGHA